MLEINLHNIKKVHFIGIGGIGVSAIARMLALRSLGEAGMRITGSDQNQSLVTDELEKYGIKVHIGHRAENLLPDTELVIYTIAIPADNPERQAAEQLGVPMMTYPEALGQISQTKKTVAIAGTHGKTTTTAMIAQIALAANLDPTVVVGSFMFDENNKRTNFIAGTGDLLIAEACEWRRSFLNLSPQILVITNIDNDHLDYYKDLADIQSAFIALVQKVPADGYLICDQSLPNVSSVAAAAKCKVIDYKLENTKNLNLLVPGAHNILNAQAALAAAQTLGISIDVAVQALNKFKGTWRRFEFKGELGGALVYDDYAHHPTEIKATLAAAKEKFPNKRIIAVFQPHLYSRTKLLLTQFAESFKDASEVIVAPIYAAREPIDPTISHEVLATAINHFTPARALDLKVIPTVLKEELKPDDLVITIGAGNVCDVADALLS